MIALEMFTRAASNCIHPFPRGATLVAFVVSAIGRAQSHDLL